MSLYAKYFPVKNKIALLLSDLADPTERNGCLKLVKSK